MIRGLRKRDNDLWMEKQQKIIKIKRWQGSKEFTDVSPLLPPTSPWSAVNIYLAGCSERHGPKHLITVSAWLPSRAPRTRGTVLFSPALFEEGTSALAQANTGFEKQLITP